MNELRNSFTRLSFTFVNPSPIDRQADRGIHTDRHTDSHRVTQTDIYTDTDRQTDTDIEIHIYRTIEKQKRTNGSRGPRYKETD